MVCISTLDIHEGDYVTTELINTRTGSQMFLMTDQEGATHLVRVSVDGINWPIAERFGGGFARDMFLKGYLAHLAEENSYLPVATAYATGDRVTTPHGTGTVTQAPTQMASGWTVRVDLDDTTATPSGHARYRLTDITSA